MKQTYGGDGSNTTTATAAYLLNNPKPLMRTLYLIGHPDDPFALFLTDHESPLTWSLYGTFLPAVIKRGQVSTKIGFEVTTLTLDYSPKNQTFGNTTATANPLQLAQYGFYDNWPVYVWTVYMPTPGDANTLGCSELFGGRVASTSVDRKGIHVSVNSFLDVVNLDVPTNTVEMTNTLASFLGAQPPAGFANVPKFVVGATSGVAPPGVASTSAIYADSTNYPGQHWANNTFAGGFLLFNGGSLDGFWSAIAASQFPTISAHTWNWFQVYTPFPWAPSPGDTFFVSTKFPIDQTDTTDYFGFPYVPDPTQAL